MIAHLGNWLAGDQTGVFDALVVLALVAICTLRDHLLRRRTGEEAR